MPFSSLLTPLVLRAPNPASRRSFSGGKGSLTAHGSSLPGRGGGEAGRGKAACWVNAGPTGASPGRGGAGRQGGTGQFSVRFHLKRGLRCLKKRKKCAESLSRHPSDPDVAFSRRTSCDAGFLVDHHHPPCAPAGPRPAWALSVLGGQHPGPLGGSWPFVGAPAPERCRSRTCSRAWASPWAGAQARWPSASGCCPGVPALAKRA